MFKSLREDIQSIFARDPAARNAFEIITTYPGVHALIFHRLAHALWRREWKWLARFLATFSRSLTGIEIHPAAQIGKRFFIDHGMGVVIGETAEIGDDVTLYHGVTLGGTSWQAGKRHPTLANGVVVGAGAKILGPIFIAEGARIGSNAVVVKDVPARASVVGIPGKVVSKLPVVSLVNEKTGVFDAYALRDSMPDPVARAIAELQQQIDQLKQQNSSPSKLG